MSGLEDFIVDVMAKDVNARKVARAARVNEKLGKLTGRTGAVEATIEGADLPTDDGNPPAAPQNVYASRDDTTGMGSITYGPANRRSPDFVVRAQVRYRKVGTSTWVTKEANPAIGLFNIPLTGLAIASPSDNFEAQAQFTDYYDRVSGWVPTTPVAAVTETYIPYLRAEKILAGSLDVLLDIVAGGEIQAGGAALNDSGVSLVDASTTIDTYPSDTGIKTDWLTPAAGVSGPLPHSGVGFHGGFGYRGAVISAEGRASDPNYGGAIELRAGNGTKNRLGTGTARLTLYSIGPSTSPVGFINIQGDLDVHGNTDFYGNVILDHGPTIALEAATKQYVDNATSVDSNSPALANGWSGVNQPIVTRRRADGFVIVQGRIKNTSGSSKPVNSVMWTLGSDRRPLIAGIWACPRTDVNGVWQGDSTTSIQVGTNGDVVTRVPVGAGTEIDLAPLIFLAEL